MSLLPKKRYECWVHYTRGGKVVKSRLKKRTRTRWGAKSWKNSIENSPAVLMAIMETAGRDGNLTWPETEIRLSEFSA